MWADQEVSSRSLSRASLSGTLCLFNGTAHMGVSKHWGVLFRGAYMRDQ